MVRTRWQSGFYIFVTSCLLFSIAGCNKPNIPQPVSDDEALSAIYPHSAEFKLSTHGAAYSSRAELCSQCHDVGPSGEKRPSAGNKAKKACNVCHDYPHSPLWALPKNHGAAYAQSLHLAPADAKQVGCTQCHDHEKQAEFEKSERARYPVACNSCHVMIPHSDDFKYGMHKEYAQNYQGKCTLCHSDLKTKYLPNLAGLGCFSCHTEGQLPTVHWEDPKSRPPTGASLKKKRSFASTPGEARPVGKSRRRTGQNSP